MSINGKFDNITREDLLSFAQQNNIKEPSAIIDGVCDVASHWPQLAKDCGVPSNMIDGIVSNMLLGL